MKTKTKLKLKNNWKTKTKKINQNGNHTVVTLKASDESVAYLPCVVSVLFSD